MELKLDPTEFRDVAESALQSALEKAGVVKAIQDAALANLAARGLLDKELAAKFLGIEPRTLEIWMRPLGDRCGRGVPHMKIGETVRFKIESLEAWAAQHEVNRVLTVAE